MLESADTNTIDAPAAPDTPQDASADTLQGLRELLARLQAELKFQKTRNDALNFEIARLKRWRFGSSSESLDTSTQAVLFDHILADTAIEDRAADEAKKPAPSTPRAKGQAVRQALPANLQRTTRLRAGPVLRAAPHPRQIRLRVLPDDCLRPHASADDRQGHCGPRAAGSGSGGQA